MISISLMRCCSFGCGCLTIQPICLSAENSTSCIVLKQISSQRLILADNELHILPSIADCYHYLNEHPVCVWCCTRAIQLDATNEACWNNLVYSLMVLDKELCARAVEKLRMDLMQAS